MSYQYKMNIANNEIFKTKIVGETPVAPLVANEIVVFITDTVDRHRGTEIAAAIKFLMNGIRDRDLLGNGGFADAAIYTAVGIDAIYIADRRTGSDTTFVVDGDVGIGLTVGVAQNNPSFNVMLESAFQQLSDFASENGWV